MAQIVLLEDVAASIPTPASGKYALFFDADGLLKYKDDGGTVIAIAQIPIDSRSAAYTTTAANAGGCILHPAADNNARTFTIDSNANVAYPLGTVITFVNLINTVTIAITSDTLYLAGSGSTGSRTLAAYGVATAMKVATTAWLISGTGLT